MKIPEYQQEVSIQPAQRQEGTVPNVLPAAYGTGVAEAQEVLGKTAMAETQKVGTSLINHLQLQQELDRKTLHTEYDSKFKIKHQEAAYNTEQEEYFDANGNSKGMRNKGYMLQMGEQGDGKKAFIKIDGKLVSSGAYATQQRTDEAIVNSLATEMPADDLSKKTWIAGTTAQRATFADQAIQYEGQQYRLGQSKIYISALDENIKTGGTVQTLEQAQSLLKEGEKNWTGLSDNAGELPADRARTKSEYELKIGESAVLGFLRNNGGDIEKTKALLDNLSLSEPNHNLIAEKILTTGKQIAEMKIYQQKQSNLKNQADAIIDVATGKDSFVNPSVALQEKAALDPKGLGEILARAKKSATSTEKVDAQGKITGKPAYSGDYSPEKANVKYVKGIKQLASAKTLEEFTKLGLDIIEKNPDMDVDQKASIAYYIGQKKDALMQQYYGPMKKALQSNPKQTAEDVGYNAIIDWADKTFRSDEVKQQAVMSYQKGLMDGKKPNAAYQDAMKSSIIIEHPEMSLYMENGAMPNGVVSKQGKANIVLPQKSTVEAHKIWNPTTFKFEDNPKRKVKSETTK